LPDDKDRKRRDNGVVQPSVGARTISATERLARVFPMQTPVQLTFRSIAHSDSLAAQIHRRVEKLEVLSDRIISCHVVIELDAHHRSRGERFRITVDLRLPGHEIVINHVPEEQFLESARETADTVFDSVEKELEAWVKRWRDQRHREAHDV
jgi:ribosome-associated translation inhibitor RaiA